MNDHEKRAEVRVPVALRIRLRYEAVDQFISKFAVNISRGGMFLSSRNPKPPGTELYFEIRLADESPVIEGTGVVRWIREYDRRRPDEPHGMGIRFVELSEESWPVLVRIIEQRRTMGEGDDQAIPEPRATVMGLGPVAPVPVAPRVAGASEPRARASDDGERGGGSGGGERGGGSGAVRAESDQLRGEILRALSRPAVPLRPAAPVRPPAPLQAGSARRDETPVVRAAVTRARALTGGGLAGDGDLERELAGLLEESAVPVAITVDEASRKLAERLGGSPVERRRPTSPPLAEPVAATVAGPVAASVTAPVAASSGAEADRRAAESAAERAAASRAMSLDEALDEVASEELTPEPQAGSGANRGEVRGGDDSQARMAAAADTGGFAMSAPGAGSPGAGSPGAGSPGAGSPGAGSIDPMPGDGGDSPRRGLLHRLLRTKT
jgi:uncharacterized protein (TIGR02266 family)